MALRPLKIITFTTDFGLKDPYQGAMKGSALRISPALNLVDITHLIPPGDIVEGAFALMSACPAFPRGTVHVGVVDPGVGGDRKGIAIETEDYFFIGPDNGLFSLVAGGEGVKRVVHLTNRRYFMKEVSNTFHGRDVFAPVAAHVCMGVDIDRLGPRLDGFGAVELPKPYVKGGVIRGEVVHIDTYGNLITNVSAGLLPFTWLEAAEVRVKNRRVKGIGRTYSDAAEGGLTAVIGSSRLLEVAVNRASAAEALNAARGTKVEVRFSDNR